MEEKQPILLLMFVLTFMTFTAAKYHNITLNNLTHVTNGSFFGPSVLKLRNQLLYVSFPKVNADYKVKLESTAINGTCERTIPISRDRELFSPKATILGNERIVVAFIEATEKKLRPYIIFHVLDLLKGCTFYSSFSTEFDDALFWSYESFSLIAYQDSFDIFAKSFLHCQSNGSLCLIRYDDKGNTLGSLNFDFDTVNSNVDLVQLHPLQEFSYSDGYLIVSKHTLNLTILDHNLKVLRNFALPGFVTAYSILNGDISVCYHVGDIENYNQYLKLDSRFKIVANVSLSISHSFMNKRLYSLIDGSTLLVLVSRSKVRTFVRRLSFDGKISLPEMYFYQCDTFVTDTQDKFIELKGGEYCFSFVCKFNMITHCVKSTEAKALLTYNN